MYLIQYKPECRDKIEIKIAEKVEEKKKNSEII